MTLAAPPRKRPLSAALLPLGLMFLAVGSSVALVFPFLSLFLSTDVHAGPVRVTVFLVVSPLTGVLLSSLIARASDRYPIRRKILIAAAASGVLGSVLAMFVRDYWVLLALVVPAYAVAGALFPQSFAYARQILERDSPDRAAMGISAMRTVFSLAWVGGPALAAVLLDIGGFRLVYGLSAGMYALAILVAVVWLEDLNTGNPAAPAPAPAAGATTTVAVATPGRWLIPLTVVAFVLLQIPMTLAVQALPLFIRDDLHIDPSRAGLILGLCAALEIPLMLGLGALTTRFSLRLLILVGGACGIAYYAIAWVAPNLWVLLAAQPLNALFICAITGVGISYMQDLLPGEPGRATTLFTNTFPIGAIVAGPLLGLSAHFGYRSAYGMATALCAAGFLFLLAAGLRRRRRVTMRDDAPPAVLEERVQPTR
ncbi:sugar efflux transporter [Dactylosporangium siamense]|uniref:Sugar efflux transporter SetB n=1 Tax=Dactylosporangium siamense TaxID=685454 RepID=A0A919PMS0_9ACTN|nr:sugar efflux transporter [Dactylosporangium siamense]GIG45260.1 sugar efflux transporter SetB [Dactylosporangium siamense]